MMFGVMGMFSVDVQAQRDVRETSKFVLYHYWTEWTVSHA